MKIHFSVIITLINFVITAMLFMTMLDEVFVPKAFFIVVWTAFISIAYWVSTQLGEKLKSKALGKIFKMTVSINIVQFIGSFLYEKWAFTNLFSSHFMMTFFMSVVTFVIVWITYILIDGERKSSKKVYNPRIGEEERPSFLQDLITPKKVEKVENDVTLILGVSRDKEQQ